MKRVTAGATFCAPLSGTLTVNRTTICCPLFTRIGATLHPSGAGATMSTVKIDNVPLVKLIAFNRIYKFAGIE